MIPLPDPQQPTAEAVGQPALDDQAQRLVAAVNEALAVPTSFRDETPVPAIGSALPVPQPGRPPMSQRATDHATVVLAYSFGSLPVGVATSLVLWRLSSVSTTTLAVIGVSATCLFLAIGTAARMIGRAVRDGASALPDHNEHHHHGLSYVTHNELHTGTRWFGTTHNRLGD